MYTAGFHDFSRPEEIINPIEIRTLADLQQWLTTEYDSEDFLNEPPLTLQSIASSFSNDNPTYLKLKGAGGSYGLVYGYSIVINKLKPRIIGLW